MSCLQATRFVEDNRHSVELGNIPIGVYADRAYRLVGAVGALLTQMVCDVWQHRQVTFSTGWLLRPTVVRSQQPIGEEADNSRPCARNVHLCIHE